MKSNYLYILALFSITFLISCFSSESVNSDSGDKPNNENFLSDDQLLDKVQKDALKYFWDYAEPNSLLARERFHPDGVYPENDANIVTTGGSGFGLMTILVGIDRKFIPRKEAVKRLSHILSFLESADRFHGAWPHWIDGNTGKVKPFGQYDNGGDLVETAFMAQGLICIKEYFKNGTQEEKKLSDKADQLWKEIDWHWYTQGGQNVLYWHWSPQYEWTMNFPLEGYNECLITYVLAASSPTHTIDAQAYHKGWARSGAIKSEATVYNIPVILKFNGEPNSVGPLFWAHYSYLGLNPKGLSDRYANYWDLNVNQTKIIYEYCVQNPKNYKGYGQNCWGLTASYTRNEDGSIGYTAHSPQNDKGVITPTAALSSFPYTPKESMKALRFFYQEQKNELIGPAGPYDAFSPNYNWVAKRYLAIDQGTIAPMIENYRSGLLWRLFMQNEDVQKGLKKLEFSFQ